MTSILKVTEIQDPTNGNKAIEIDSSGNITTAGYIKRAKNCAFRVNTPTAASAVANGTLCWVNEDIDTDNCFTPSNGRFIAPVDGIYYFATHILINEANYGVLNFNKNGSIVAEAQAHGSSSNYDSVVGSVVVEMDAGDRFELYWYGGSYGNAHQSSYSTFNGFLISAT